MDVHPVAEMFPLLEGEDFAALLEDMRISGQRQAIVLDKEGRILDGRNRWRACEALGIEPKTVIFEGDDPVEYVWSLNDQRRHLTKWQRAMILVRASKSEDMSGMTDRLSRLLNRDVKHYLYEEARMVAKWTPSLVEDSITGAIGYREARERARRARAEHDSDGRRFDELKNNAPDLADQVVNETLTLGEAYAAMAQRYKELAERQESDTKFLIRHIRDLAGISGFEKRTVDNYSSKYAGPDELTEAEITEAGKVIAVIKRAWKARKGDG